MPVVTCGAESWTQTKPEKMFGPTHEDCYWRIKVNKEICNKFKYPDIVTYSTTTTTTTKAAAAATATATVEME
jgi:hypothetical protein